METLRTKLTYANVISTLCLFLVLGGGAAFAATKLPKNSVGAKQLKNNSVSAAKIKNGAVTGVKIDLSTLGTVPNASRAETATSATHAETAANASHADAAATAGSASSATDAKALEGKPASAFAASTVVRSARVLADATVVAALSDGITQGNIGPHSTGGGLYCIDGLSPPPKTAVATIDFGASPESTIYTEVTPPGEPGCQVYVATYNPGGLAVDVPFSLLLH